MKKINIICLFFIVLLMGGCGGMRAHQNLRSIEKANRKYSPPLDQVPNHNILGLGQTTKIKHIKKRIKRNSL